MTDDTRWQAVLTRDRALDGAFVYAVRSTGIYCRPSCPSRRPRRESVTFFPETGAAERAGFRACRRCRPGEAPAEAELVARVCRLIETHLEAGPVPTLDALGAAVGFSPAHLQKVFKRVLGLSPREYGAACRLKRLKAGLQAGENVTTATYAAGYGSSSRVYAEVPAQLGMTPAVYRRGAPGVRIRYATLATPLGLLLVAATERGLCAVSLGASETALVAALRKEYPAAELAPDSGELNGWAQALAAHVRGAGPLPALPLDVQATAFQGRVWHALGQIPRGETRTYQQVAQAIGQPRAARAVARACATNPVALVVPCHRVVRADGGLGGYRWGVQRKRRLLDQEKESGNI